MVSLGAALGIVDLRGWRIELLSIVGQFPAAPQPGRCPYLPFPAQQRSARAV